MLASSSSRCATGLACVAAAALTLGGCATSDSGVQTRVGQVPAGSAPVTAESPAAMPDQPLGEVNSAPKTSRAEAPAQLAVTGVRVTSSGSFDRVEFDLAGSGQPGWFTDYTASPVQEISGQPLQVDGSAYLSVLIDGTVYPSQLTDATGSIGTGIGSDIGAVATDSTLPPGRTEGAGAVAEVVAGGTSEGRTQFVIGLRDTASYSVQLVDDPRRVIIDIARR